MTRYPLTSRLLSEEACHTLHEATTRLLLGTGVEVQHEGARALLGKAGALVDGSRVRIPSSLVDQALEMAPRRVRITSRSGNGSMELESGVSYFGSGSDCLFSAGPGPRDRRPVTLTDVEEMAALQDKLPNIDYVMSMAHPYELDPNFVPVAQFAAMLKGTSKPILMVAENATHLELFSEMAAVCGARDSWGLYAMSTPPLTHGFESASRLIRCAELGVPMIYGGAYLQGATVPASLPAYFLVANVEMLSGLVISQLARPGAPFVYGVAMAWMNPRTAHVVYSSAEQMLGQQASADLARYYRLPTFGYGGVSDSQMLDEQWALEAGMTLLTAAIAGVTLIHDVGYLASGKASSYESMTVLDEQIGYVKAYLGGVTLDEESLAIDEIAAVGPGGTHLTRKYTRRHVRDFHAPQLISHDTYEGWVAAGGPSLLSRAAERTRELRAERTHQLGTDVLCQLDKLIDTARQVPVREPVKPRGRH
jgi:trimethylamine--corrinoid protein Co-methyltransferase